jgi:hypothetical protein
MKTLIATVIIAGVGLIGAASAQAMPQHSLQNVQATPIIKVIEGCGPNEFRGPEGHCRPRGTCPPGWHPGPEGWHCFRN